MEQDKPKKDYNNVIKAIKDFIIIFFLFLFFLLNIPAKKFVLNINSGKLHRIDCHFVERITPRYRKYLVNINQANKDSVNKCKSCIENE